VAARNSRTPDEVLDFLDDDAQPEQSPTPKQEPSNGVVAQQLSSAPVQEEEDDEEEAIDSGDDSDEDVCNFLPLWSIKFEIGTPGYRIYYGGPE
jgi:hypothetical protein